MDSIMITTDDNPFDPFTQFSAWYAWDSAHGYNTCGLLDRIAITSEELSFADNELAIEQAMEEIASENVSGSFKIVRRPVDGG